MSGRRSWPCAAVSFALLGADGVALAVSPQMGGSMKHVFITLGDDAVSVSLEGDPSERLWLQDYGQVYAPPADVLDGSGYNAQYGWLAGGFVSPPPGAGIWIERVEQTEGLRTYQALTFVPIFGTEGTPFRWQWDGTMTHNWYAVDECGKYEATYDVYVGDAMGEPVAGFLAARVTLRWQFLREDEIGDMDTDGVVTFADFAAFQACFTGSGPHEMATGCGCFDFDGDEDVDLDDNQVFMGRLQEH